jgi:hypothetical protein
MAAIIKGMENGMREAMIAMGGADKVLLEDQDVPADQEHLAELAPGRTMNDVLALKHAAPLLRLISPEMSLRNITASRGEKMSCLPKRWVSAGSGRHESHTLDMGDS